MTYQPREQARLDRQQKLVPFWHDAAKITVADHLDQLRAKRLGGIDRPLDMGGPRDRWIDVELWELAWIDAWKHAER